MNEENTNIKPSPEFEDWLQRGSGILLSFHSSGSRRASNRGNALDTD